MKGVATWRGTMDDVAKVAISKEASLYGGQIALDRRREDLLGR